MATTSGLELLYHSVVNDLKAREDAFVVALHWCMIVNGYKCIGIESEVATNLENVIPSELLPKNWNQNEDVYTLQYVSADATRSNSVILLTAIRVDRNMLINAFNSQNEKTASMNASVEEYVEENLGNFSALFRNAEELLNRYRTEILQNLQTSSLTPRLPNAERAEKNRNSGQRVRGQEDDPLRVTQPLRMPQPSSSGWADLNDPLAIGRSDLDPLGRRGGGMLMDPRQRFPGMSPYHPAAGIPGQLPRGSVPPGARFDPFGPPNPDALPGSQPPTGPNPDHLKPPDFDDMFS